MLAKLRKKHGESMRFNKLQMIVNDHVPVTFDQIVRRWPKKNESDSNVSAMVEYLPEENRVAAMVSIN